MFTSAPGRSPVGATNPSTSSGALAAAAWTCATRLALTAPSSGYSIVNSREMLDWEQPNSSPATSWELLWRNRNSVNTTARYRPMTLGRPTGRCHTPTRAATAVTRSVTCSWARPVIRSHRGGRPSVISLVHTTQVIYRRTAAVTRSDTPRFDHSGQSGVLNNAPGIRASPVSFGTDSMISVTAFPSPPSTQARRVQARSVRPSIGQSRARAAIVRPMVDALPLRIFLASPSDLENEREVVRACVDEHNVRRKGQSNVTYEVVGWDRVRGTARRPQEAINELISESHFMVTMFKGSWGSEPGSPWGYTSGTEEELFTGLLELGLTEQPMRDPAFRVIRGFWRRDRGITAGRKAGSLRQARKRLEKRLPILSLAREVVDGYRLETCM